MKCKQCGQIGSVKAESHKMTENALTLETVYYVNCICGMRTKKVFSRQKAIEIWTAPPDIPAKKDWRDTVHNDLMHRSCRELNYKKMVCNVDGAKIENVDDLCRFK